MDNINNDRHYTHTHEWAKLEEGGIVTVGVTEHAQHLLGDIVFIELPEPGQKIRAGAEVGVIESVKAAADYYSPVTGEIVEINERLIDQPVLVNQDAEGEAWLFKVMAGNVNEYKELLTAEQYSQQIAEEKV